jgi:2-dehydro-3-deoxyphosphooctonate aldolase (KDO 8-P synthase)
MQEVKIKNISLGSNKNLVVIAGPCVIESEELVLKVAETLKKVCVRLKMPLIFKASYDKANRTSHKSFRGPGLKKGLEILQKVKRKFKLPVISDVHCKREIKKASEVLDVIQIPAYLCRQTDLIIEASKTKKVINIKKAQFLAPWDVKNIVEKIKSKDNKNIIITERGTSFGYNNLVVDICSLPILRKIGYPVCMDITHSLQLPGGGGTYSSGRAEFIFHLARAAVACGVDAIFLETHPEPENALSDGKNSLPLSNVSELLKQLKELHSLTSKFNWIS